MRYQDEASFSLVNALPFLTFKAAWLLSTLLCSCPCAVGAIVAAPAVLGAAGFTSAGIAAGSVAAKMMSVAAVANGGGVAAGSVVAALQSAGKSYEWTFCCGFSCCILMVMWSLMEQ